MEMQEDYQPKEGQHVAHRQNFSLEAQMEEQETYTKQEDNIEEGLTETWCKVRTFIHLSKDVVSGGHIQPPEKLGNLLTS
jgi:hypothetical protein